MKVAILGSGSAGVMAAAHLSRHFPQLALWHVFDPARPPLGVGEGTTAGFRVWLEEVAPGSSIEFHRTCKATLKRGVQFEDWGAGGAAFVHDFVPQDNPGLHISAADLPTFFAARLRATPVHGRVTRILRHADRVTLDVSDGRTLSVDLIIDARGFPSPLGPEHIALPWVPTNAALVTRGPACVGLERTRAVARPHGWIFVIPLSDYTSYGYVYSDSAASGEEVRADFAAFLASEAVEASAVPRTLRFPNFVCREIFDGQICRVGNAASFIEPLEATSIALIKTELTLLDQWLRLATRSTGPRMARDLAANVNAALRRTAIEVSLFIAWHYAAGSAHDTPFWKNARRGFAQGLSRGVPAEVRARFDAHLERAAEFSAAEVLAARTRKELERLLQGSPAFPIPFGGMTPLGFAQMAEGLAGRQR